MALRNLGAHFLAAAMATLLTVSCGSRPAVDRGVPTSSTTRSLTAYPGGTWEPGPSRFGAVMVDDIPLKMDDGVELRAAVAFPTDPVTGKRAPGPFPVIVEHTPYVRLRGAVTPNTFFTEHGYIYALVHPRGTGRSGGEVQMRAPREGLDGKAIVDWAAHKLEGSDGRVAIVGCSWPGAVALTDAAFVGRGSPLKAVVAACVGFESINRESWMVAGLPTMGFWTFAGSGAAMVGDTAAAKTFFRQIATDVQAGGDPAYDRDFWRDRGTLERAKDVVDNGVPVLLWSGWSDIVETAAVRTYVAFQNAYNERPVYAPMTADERVTPRYQLIMGNWEHAQGLDAGIVLEWIETWLKGVDTGIQKTASPMHLFEPGTNRWVNTARYPAVTRSTRWHLGARESLVEAPAGADGSDRLAWGDPENTGSRLAFTTAPLAEAMTLGGPISATLYASSSNANIELIARLYDVAPDGVALLISRGAVLGSQRALDAAKSWTDAGGTMIWPWPTLQRDEPLRPGEVYRLDIALAPRQWGIAAAHALRLELTTQTPAALCPPTGPPAKNDAIPCRLTDPQRATVPGGTYTIMFGPRWPSTVNLPQLTASSLPEVRAGTPPTAWLESERRMGVVGSGDRSFELPLDWSNDGDRRDRK